MSCAHTSTPAPYPHPHAQMSPPRRLAVLHSHLRPDFLAPPADRGENELTARQEAVVSISPCAAAGDDSRGAAAGRVADGELETCIFCRIIRDEAPAFKVYEDDVCMCILDSHPLAPGHSLIIPKCHFSSLEATPPPTHFHIIPRRSGDKLWSTESFRRSSIEPNETSSLISCIKEQLDSSPGDCKN